ncbi:phage head closure protein [Lactiplantibacillus pentosus]|uniref:Prophage Lp3 protein 11 n=1 Tax=Lactiplantibacillus pentosus DSM 20314 TaxID=1423791 RepID=A0A837R7U3_LACPE|nr:phage head closure protein [Lactiplantibacillus pentosus]AYG38890.1 head-tail adaptor protein [Lactiplantibacillus pentosus]AYG41550.1 head-tail adaptor protein [Lactiplantibacillus pentosus]AYJ40440.1 head-tail adaptor protein [Lactiplantibacillus pentosus]KRK23644.1 prophage Lp3 protein 11 [Lactiplantibacillus pentosus DSM 20314]MCT3311859.1 head-tail adaptor protein [Lactiplantibacillus pentosus]
MKNYSLNRLNKRVQFGTVKSVQNPINGTTKQQFVPLFTVWCGEYTLTISNTISLTGTTATTNQLIAVRHDERITTALLALLDGVEYKVAGVSSDSDMNAYDVVTLTKVNGHG